MKKTIVVADDFDNTRWVIEFALRELNCNILHAKDGVEALKHFDGRQIDLLITDHNMPNKDGTELVKDIREMNDYKYIPALMLTTETDQKKKDNAKKVLVTAWIRKPFKQEDFFKVVKKVLSMGSVNQRQPQLDSVC